MSSSSLSPLPAPPALALGSRCALVVGVRSNSLARAERDWVDSPAWGTDAARPVVVYGRGALDALPSDSLDVIVVGQDAAETDAPGFWGAVRRALAQGGRVLARFPVGAVDPEAARARLVIGGFVDARVDPLALLGEASRPTWKQDDAVPLKKRAKAPVPLPTAAIALIDEDALLDDCGGRAGAVTSDDLVGVPVKKAACKNCTCGLKELESKSEDVRVLVDAQDATALSADAAGGGSGGCGSCAKGDAFRCGGCPYLGLPAFTPGTRPEIVTREDGTRVLKLGVESDVF